MGSRDIFTGFLNFDDWLWFVIIGGGFLLVLVTIMTCCCCAKRARRKGREEALAALAQQQQQQQREVRINMANRNNLDHKTSYQPPQSRLALANQESLVVSTPERNEANRCDFQRVESPSARESAVGASVYSQRQSYNMLQKQSYPYGQSALKDRINALRHRSSISTDASFVMDKNEIASLDKSEVDLETVGAVASDVREIDEAALPQIRRVKSVESVDDPDISLVKSIGAESYAVDESENGSFVDLSYATNPEVDIDRSFHGSSSLSTDDYAKVVSVDLDDIRVQPPTSDGLKIAAHSKDIQVESFTSIPGQFEDADTSFTLAATRPDSLQVASIDLDRDSKHSSRDSVEF